MKIRILIVCLAIIFVFCSCGSNAPIDNTPLTNTSGITTTTTASNTTTFFIDQTTTNTTLNGTQETLGTTDSHSTVTTTTTTITTNSAESANTTTSSTVPSSTTSSVAQSDTIIFKATIRENLKRQPISGVTVTVYVDGGSAPAGSGVTDQNGVASILLKKGHSYRVVLSTLPNGYEANADYRFSTATVNITIRKSAVQNELDHSEAQYDVGDTMTNFTLTDTDGHVYRLSDLLQEKKLIILNFWFTSCEPCKMEFPFFEAAVQAYGDDIALLAIDPIDSTNAIANLRDRFNVNPDTAITFPMMRDTCKLYMGFDVISYPTTVFIDENGIILDIQTGSFPNEYQLFSKIDRYLNQ